MNTNTDETLVITDNGGSVLAMSFEHVEGEEEDVNLLGTGQVKKTWIIYPDEGYMVEI